jgi:hypothetical protein
MCACTWFDTSPIDDDWPIPKGSGQEFLVKYLVSQQIFFYGKSFDQPRKILLRNMKLLLKNYPEDDIKRAIALGCLKSEHPFSTKFIQEMLEWLQDIRYSPVQQYYQNKS